MERFKRITFDPRIMGGKPYLYFGAILAATDADGPSVIQVRTQNIMRETIGRLVIGAINQFMRELDSGALISINPQKARARILPFS